MLNLSGGVILSCAAKSETGCDHGLAFDAAESVGLPSAEVRLRWPRLAGPCPKGCGFVGIAYASYTHYLSGDW